MKAKKQYSSSILQKFNQNRNQSTRSPCSCNQLLTIPPLSRTQKKKKTRQIHLNPISISFIKQLAMGIVFGKQCRAKHCDAAVQLKARVQLLEGELRRLGLVREREADEHEREMRKCKEEASRLRRKAEEDDERIQSLEGELALSRDIECDEWQHWLGTECLVEHMKEEQAQREAAVEKWKQLYLTIKNELDDLILRTKQGGRFGVGVEEGLIDQLQAEVISKEETIEALRSRILLLEKEGIKREREIDILRQSLRILNNSKRNGMRRKLQRRWLL